MSYSTGQTLALSRVRACTGFTGTTNTSETDWKMLNTGRSDHYAILRPGAFSGEWLSATVIMWHYVTVIELWQQYTDDTTTQSNLYTHIGNLITGLLPERKMNDTVGSVNDATPKSAGEVEEMWKGSGGPAWLRWSVSLEWTEQQEITYTD
jgi:hypothetical protein